LFDFWWRPALMLGGILFAALLAAALFSVTTGIALFVLGVLGYLVYNLHQMAALIHWLERGERGGIPQVVWRVG